MDFHPKKINHCWIVTEGMAGTENQCLGVAESLGVTPEIKRVKLRQPWKALSPWFGFETAETFDPALQPPWPDLLISCGRKSVAASRYIKKMSGRKTFTVHLQDPRISPKNFDLLAVPAHDPTRGPNVIVTPSAPNRVTPQKLEEARHKFPQFDSLPAPRVAVMIGGDSRAHTLTPSVMKSFVAQLKNLDASLMITASRRTGPESNAILESLKDRAYIWDGAGENPYFAFLAYADFILVTADSVSMLSEAATTGKPVYMVSLKGGSARFDKFYKSLTNSGALRRWEGKLECWTYKPLRDAETIAAEIRKRLSR